MNKSALETRMHELKDLDGILGILSWDEETYAPNGARAGRGRQTGTLEAIRHQRLVDPALGDLVQSALADNSLDPAFKTAVRRLKRTRDLSVKLPESLVKALAEARSASLEAWQRAKKEADFKIMRPHLEKIFQLTLQKADALGSPTGVRYDALLDEYEPEMTVAVLAPVLHRLRDRLVPLVAQIVAAKRQPDQSFLKQHFDDKRQWDFTMRLLRDLGFDLERGRQDRSAHPFTSGSSQSDVRVTTRVYEDNLTSAIFSTVHECGHGLYEQGFLPEHDRTPLASAPSMGIHESQSRLWENQIGRSRAFWSHYLPVLRSEFPGQLDNVSLDAFYKAVNLVEPSLVRVEADEVTYNLHILLRFELELAMVKGDLAIADLPGAWNEKMKSYLGVTPPNDAEGCLQDIHWGWGAIGYFPTYTIGNLYAAQLMKAYEQARPQVWDDVAKGDHKPLLTWLRDKIHHRGYLASAQEIVTAAVGKGLEIDSFVAYLTRKYSELYGL